jgi:hypothetical protein
VLLVLLLRLIIASIIGGIHGLALCQQ